MGLPFWHANVLEANQSGPRSWYACAPYKSRREYLEKPKWPIIWNVVGVIFEEIAELHHRPIQVHWLCQRNFWYYKAGQYQKFFPGWTVDGFHPSLYHVTAAPGAHQLIATTSWQGKWIASVFTHLLLHLTTWDAVVLYVLGIRLSWSV